MRFDAELWLWRADSAWHFVTVPPELSDEIAARTASLRRGFGSVRVQATIGSTTWATSVFPDKQRGAYVLPVKKGVRHNEHVGAGDTVVVELSVLDVG